MTLQNHPPIIGNSAGANLEHRWMRVKGNQRVPPIIGAYGRPEKRSGLERDQGEAGRSRQVPEGQVRSLRRRDDRKGSQTERKQRPGLPAIGLGGQARQNHSHRLMARGMALKSIKIGEMGIEDLDRVIHIQEIIIRNKIGPPKTS